MHFEAKAGRAAFSVGPTQYEEKAGQVDPVQPAAFSVGLFFFRQSEADWFLRTSGSPADTTGSPANTSGADTSGLPAPTNLPQPSAPTIPQQPLVPTIPPQPRARNSGPHYEARCPPERAISNNSG